MMDGGDDRTQSESNLMVNLMVDDMSMMEDSTHHDSQMITQEISDDDGEDNTQGQYQMLTIVIPVSLLVTSDSGYLQIVGYI